MSGKFLHPIFALHPMYIYHSFFKVAHNNMGFDSIVLKNSMSKFGVKRPRDGHFATWFHIDSLEVMRGEKVKMKR